MAIERTLSILKPDTVEKNKIGEVIALIEKAGLKVIAGKFAHLSRPQAEGFYAEHKARGFFGEISLAWKLVFENTSTCDSTGTFRALSTDRR